ncbi:MAG TPA: alkaline phosphatase family protein [Steroidobacteraceae bacterium]|nr:alkaline phosphatase family protein [Steroidobacteraceae bacterium]
MTRTSRFVWATFLGLAIASSAMAGKTRNVVLIISDGLRPEEMFTGVEEDLLDPKNGGSWMSEEQLRARYWNPDPKVRRELLFPFIWHTIGTQGQLLGNAQAGSRAQVANGLAFSYPGYNEMSTGIPDPRINSNEFGPNPNQTVFEWLSKQPGFRGKVEIFGTWDTFHDIFNESRSHLPIRAGRTLVDPNDHSPRGELLSELYRTTTLLEDADPPDSFLTVSVLDHLKTHRPRVMFVGYGDTDSWAHQGRYDLVVETAHHFDAAVAALWNRMQSLPEYKDKTTFILTADHGRGHGLVEWKEHGVDEKGSENIWIAIIGPDTPPLGERHNVAAVTQSQLAATVAALLGEDYRQAEPRAAKPLLDVLNTP